MFKEIDVPVGVDVIGDVHGCYDEFTELIGILGYDTPDYAHPDGRILVLTGDLTDRGPRNVDMLMWAIINAKHLTTLGNHDDKLMRWLKGNPVQLSHGLAITAAQIEAGLCDGEAFKQIFYEFLNQLPIYIIFTKGEQKLVVSHAGIRREWVGEFNERIRTMCIYGQITGEKDEHGFPVRSVEWYEDWTDPKWTCIHGHIIVPEVTRINNVINVDTGCVFGRSLSAYRWPEGEIVSVPAKAVWSASH